MKRRKVLIAAGAIAAAFLAAAVKLDPRAGDYRANASALLQATPEAQRIWAHRVNSLGALDEAKPLFAGVELDLVFDSATRTFEVRHPPKPGTGLTLDRYLASAADRPALRFWFDWKNPRPDNLAAALAELDRLESKYAIRHRVLVETPSDATFPEIPAVSRRGYLHGYYLPTERALAALREGPEAVARLGAEVRTTMERGGYGAVTYDARLQPFVDLQLDRFLQERKLRRFSWEMSIDSSDPATDPQKLSRITRARKLDALLIGFPSRFRI